MTAPRTQLRLVDDGAPTLAHPIAALAAGQPVYLPTVDFWEILDGPALTDLDRDVDELTAGEVILAWYQTHIGLERRTEGDRAQGIQSDLGRYLLPFAIESAMSQPADLRSFTTWRRHRECHDLVKMLAGDHQLPAATVAGDLLGRRAVTAIWLTVPEAGQVSHGGAGAVRDAIDRGAVRLHKTAGKERVLSAADLRRAGLLIERDPSRNPWGLAHDTSKGILGVFGLIVRFALDNGTSLKGNLGGLGSAARVGDSGSQAASAT